MSLHLSGGVAVQRSGHSAGWGATQTSGNVGCNISWTRQLPTRECRVEELGSSHASYPAYGKVLSTR